MLHIGSLQWEHVSCISVQTAKAQGTFHYSRWNPPSFARLSLIGQTFAAGYDVDNVIRKTFDMLLAFHLPGIHDALSPVLIQIAAILSWENN